jgi:drug/metabolite transporter (DMT)-like permease
MKEPYSHLLAPLCLVLAMFLWGSSFIALKLAFADYHPMLVIFGRMSIASIAFIFFLPRFRTVRVRRQDWILLAGMALAEPCLYFIFEALALKNTSASQASVITTMLPLLVSVASAFLLSEKFSLHNYAGLSLAMLGAVALSLGGEVSVHAPNPFLGNFYEFIAMICATVYTIAVKRLSSRYPALFITAFQAIIGTFFFAPFLLLPGVSIPSPLPPVSTTAIVYLGLAVTLLAYGLYNFALSLMDAGKAAVYINLIPLFTMGLGWFIFNEVFTTSQYIAGLIIFTGVGLSQNFWIKKHTVPKRHS